MFLTNQHIDHSPKYISKQLSLFFSLAFLLLFSSQNLLAQKEIEYIISQTIILNEDTLPYFEIPEVLIIPPYKFTSKKQRRRYSRLVRDLKKVYPYAKMANTALLKIASKIDSIDNKKVAKRYIKLVDKQLQKRYGKELKKLTVRQGRLLIKLIDRETGSTSYELIKELRGSFSAFMWQSLARLFGENLKEEYDAEEEDKMIEHIILLIEHGQL